MHIISYIMYGVCARRMCYLNGIPRKCFSEPRGIQVTRSLGGFQTRPWILMKLKQQQSCWYRCNTLHIRVLIYNNIHIIYSHHRWNMLCIFLYLKNAVVASSRLPRLTRLHNILIVINSECQLMMYYWAYVEAHHNHLIFIYNIIIWY